MKHCRVEARSLAVALFLWAALSCAPLIAAASSATTSGATSYQEGQAAAKAGLYAEAVKDYRQALLLGYDDPVAFYQLGLAYEKVKQWNYAVWAIAAAMTDASFVGTHPEATAELDRAQRGGGANSGPPPGLAKVTVSPTSGQIADPTLAAVQESQAAYTALQQGSYFVSTGFNQVVTFSTASALVSAAQDSNDNSNTAVKFVYLDAIPAPYTSLATYSHDLFSHLGLSRAVVVTITPKAAGVYSDRLNAAAVARIVAHEWQAIGMGDPVNLGATIARAVVSQADANDGAAQTKDVIITVAAIVLGLAVIGAAMYFVLGTGRRQRGRAAGHSAIRARTRLS